jgi:hypothetical protein
VFGSRFVVSHISRKTSEMWGTRELGKVKSCGKWKVLEDEEFWKVKSSRMRGEEMECGQASAKQ